MSKNYDHKVLLGGASFPVIGEGLFLFTGLDGEVTGVNLPSLNFSKFTQEIPSDRWFFEHNFGYLPLVQVYSQGRVITESVTVNVTNTTVTVQTDNGIQIAGYITLMGAGSSFGGNSSTPDPDNDILSSLMQTLESHERMRGRGYHVPDAGITNDQVAESAGISWSKISKVGANPADLGAQPAGDYATLVNGVVPTSLLPTNSIINIYPANSESAMLATNGIEQGDMVLRTDFTPPEVWMLIGSPASSLNSWRRTDVTVTSVNNQIGTVVLTASDVGALPVNDPSVTNSRTPIGNAGGDLAGTYPNPTLSSADLRAIASLGASTEQGILQKTGVATWRLLSSISSTLISGLRALAFKDNIENTDVAINAGISWSKISKIGANPTDVGALPANDPSVTNSRVPTGSAGGDLEGSYPNPILKATSLGRRILQQLAEGITDTEIASNAAISWNKIAAPTLEHGCKIYSLTSVPISTSGNWSYLSLNRAAFDSDGLFSTADGAIRIVKPGYYLLEAACNIIEATASTTPPGPFYFKLAIRNGGTIKSVNFAYSPIPTIGISLSGTRIEYMNAGDIVQMCIWQNSGRSLVVMGTNAPTPAQTWLGAYLIR